MRTGGGWIRRADIVGRALLPDLSLLHFSSLHLQSDYILDAGLAAGLELPYTCRSGICGACVGRVAAGAVDMSDVSFFQFFLLGLARSGTKKIRSLTLFLPPFLI